ncbi:unnamed protein product [Closterium sp. NIES-53]
MSLPLAVPPQLSSAATVTPPGLIPGQIVAPPRAMASLLVVALSAGAQPAPRLSPSPLARPGSDLYTLTTEFAQVAELGQVAAPVEVAASCSCWLLTHLILLWHHRIVHPSLPLLRGMHSRLLVSGLPRSMPPLPRSLAPPCLPCVEERQHAAPHSSFPPTTVPLLTLHMDMWGPARITGQGGERYFLLVVDDYTCYTTVLPLQSKADVRTVLIRWICAVRLQLSARFRRDLPILQLQSDRGGEFFSHLLHDFCGVEGITKSFTLLASPQQNGIVEHRIGLVMEVDRTSMIHVAAPHFLWQFAVRYAVQQLNLWPRVSHPETSPNLQWTGEIGDVSAFLVGISVSLVPDLPASKLSPRTLQCVFLGFPTDAPPCPPPPQGPAPSGVSQVDPPPLVAPLEVCYDTSGPAEGGDPAADETAATCRSLRLETPLGFPPRPSSPPLQPVAADPGAEGGGDTGGADSGGAGSGRQPSRQETLSPQQLRAWAVRRGSSGGGAGGADIGGPTGGTGVGGARGTGAGGTNTGGATKDTGVEGTGGADTGGAGISGARDPAGGAGTGGAVTTGAGGAGAGGSCPRARGFGGATTQQQPSALHHLLSLPPAVTEFPIAGTTPPLLVKRPSSLPAFKVRYVARGFSQREEVDFFQTFSPTLKMTTVRVLLHVAAQRDYELHFTRLLDSLPAGQSSRGDLAAARRTITLTESHMVQQVLQRFGFRFSSPQPTPLPTGHLLSAPPSDESVEPSGQYPELMGCLMYLMTCEAEIYAGAMAAQELRWLTYVLSDLGEGPRSPPVPYVNNKDMIALCQDQRLEHRMKHIPPRYFLEQDLQKCGQLRLSYMALQANTTDVFTKVLGSSDHEHFCTALGLVPTLPHPLVS